MTRRPRRLLLPAVAGALMAAATVRAQHPAPTGKQDTSFGRDVKDEDIRRFVRNLRALHGESPDAGKWGKAFQDYLKNNPNPATTDAQKKLAEQFLEKNPQLKNDPKAMEQFLKDWGVDPDQVKAGKGFDPKSINPKGLDGIKGFDPKGLDPKGANPSTGGNAGAESMPLTGQDPGGPIPGKAGGQFPQGGPGQLPQQPPGGASMSADQLSKQQQQYKQFTGWWEQNVGPLNETPAVKGLIAELFSDPSGNPNAPTLGDALNGADAKDLPDLGGSGWKMPSLGDWGGGGSPTGGGFSAPESSYGAGGLGSGGFSGGASSWLPVVLLAVFAGGALVLWWLWPKLGARADRPRPLPGLGPWPLDPRHIADRDALVRAFEYLSVLVCGSGARTWNHVTIAAALEGAVPRADELAGPLARLYAVARYTPADEPVPPADIAEARGYLCELAGVSAA